jgi:CRISPR-associated endonuclease/helicase Cas3
VRFVGGGQDPADPSQTFVLVPHLEATAQQLSRRIRLDQHCERVAELGRRLAGAANDDPTIARAVEIAGRYHDCGKLDPRFQRWLFLGEEPDGDSPLAKSGISTRSARSEAARKAAGWPSGKRHESLSALLLARAEFAADREFDITLATYLVAVHHGWNRPFLPKEEPDPDPAVIEASIEGRPVTVRSDETLDWGAQVTACGRLNQHHGPWGLALIEAALIQADWLASEEEQTTHRKEVA